MGSNFFFLNFKFTVNCLLYMFSKRVHISKNWEYTMALPGECVQKQDPLSLLIHFKSIFWSWLGKKKQHEITINVYKLNKLHKFYLVCFLMVLCKAVHENNLKKSNLELVFSLICSILSQWSWKLCWLMGWGNEMLGNGDIRKLCQLCMNLWIKYLKSIWKLDPLKVYF